MADVPSVNESNMHVLYANVCNTAMAMPSQASVYASGSCHRGYTAPTLGCMTECVTLNSESPSGNGIQRAEMGKDVPGQT
jgi:hypothetical protein